MAQNRMQERIRSSALGTAIMSLVAFYLGDRIGAYIVFGLDMQLGSQVTRGLQALIAKPLYLARPAAFGSASIRTAMRPKSPIPTMSVVRSPMTSTPWKSCLVRRTMAIS